MDAPPTAQPNSYDEVPYKSHPIYQSHPDVMATVATLFGMSPAPLESCRVLELGCASGGNLLPIADQYPDSQFIGIDGSARQIADGNSMLSQLGLRNVELRCQDILTFASEKPFDFVICHGVYSWVPEAVQQKILEICNRSLAPQGVAYVSYNTFPGWHMRGMIRDMMRYRADSFEQPQQKLDEARGLLEFLSEATNVEGDPFGNVLRQELETIVRRVDDYYLFHDHLEEVNLPVYFHQFADRAASHGLRYLGEAVFGVMSTGNLPEGVREKLRRFSRNEIETEQYMDFLRNRTFRQTLLCHDDIHVERPASPQQMMKLRVASDALPDALPPEGATADTVVYRRGNPKLTTTNAIVKSAMHHLKTIWPASIPFRELARISGCASSGVSEKSGREVMSSDTEKLATLLLRCCETSVIDLHFTAPRFTKTPGQFPTVSSLARTQATQGNHVTNRRHELVALNDLQRQVVAACDGTKNRPELIEALCQALLSGKLIVHQEGIRVMDPDVLRTPANSFLPDVLDDLARRAMFIA